MRGQFLLAQFVMAAGILFLVIGKSPAMQGFLIGVCFVLVIHFLVKTRLVRLINRSKFDPPAEAILFFMSTIFTMMAVLGGIVINEHGTIIHGLVIGCMYMAGLLFMVLVLAIRARREGSDHVIEGRVIRRK